MLIHSSALALVRHDPWQTRLLSCFLSSQMDLCLTRKKSLSLHFFCSDLDDSVSEFIVEYPLLRIER